MTKGFTLIELLVTIAVLAVLAVGGFNALDFADKINYSNDSKVQTDIGQIASALDAYAIAHSGVYATSFSLLESSGDLKTIPAAPGNYSSYSLGQITGSPNNQSVCGQLKAKKYTASPAWVWCSSTGRAGMVANCSLCP